MQNAHLFLDNLIGYFTGATSFHKLFAITVVTPREKKGEDTLGITLIHPVAHARLQKYRMKAENNCELCLPS